MGAAALWRRLRLNPGPSLRLAIGLSMMSVCLFMGLDLATGLVPDPGHQAARVRAVQAEALAERVSLRLGRQHAGDADAEAESLQRLFRDARAGESQIQAIALRGEQGAVIAAAGDWARLPPYTSDDRSSLDRILVPIERNQQQWGRLEVAFQPVYPQSLLGWLTLPVSLTVLGLTVIGIPLYGLYLRRALHLLDPSSAVPGRVRAAFDTLAEGVVVLDKDGRVVLANEVFHELMPAGQASILGTRLADMPWLMEALDWTESVAPWTRAVAEGRAVESVGVHLPAGAEGATQPMAGAGRRFVLRANPISDPSGARRGCILTFDDVSALFESNERLSEALITLEASKAQVQEQNVALARLASRDPLTDCLNRRAFYEASARLWEVAGRDGRAVSLAMCDIDHFKQVNDRYGHSAGDLVIKATADWLRRITRDEDLICRMGGEEFCVVWTQLPPDQAMARAEALRRLAEQASITTEDGQIMKVTLSVGLIMAQPGQMTVEAMIENADQALYQAKRSGRNRVLQWSAAASALPASAALV